MIDTLLKELKEGAEALGEDIDILIKKDWIVLLGDMDKSDSETPIEAARGKASKSESETQIPANKEKEKSKFSTKDINILVIDDEQIIRDLFTRILGAKGYNVICAKDGFEAVEMAKDKRIDLVFIDIKLPGGMNGVGTFRLLKKEKPGIKAVMITGFSVEKKIGEAIENGAVGALKKPFDNIQEIYDVIEKNVRKDKGGAKNDESYKNSRG